MASAIDPTKPETGLATTASVRANFEAAKNEVENLQSGVIDPASAAAGIGTGLTFKTVAALTAYQSTSLAMTTPTAGFRVLGRNTYGDAGAGTFIWKPADTSTPDGGTIFQADAGGVGRWFRVIENGADFDPYWFGAVGDGVADDTAALQACIDAAIARNYGVTVRKGNYLVGPVYLNGSAWVAAGKPEAGQQTFVKYFRGEAKVNILATFTAKPGAYGSADAVITGRNGAGIEVSGLFVMCRQDLIDPFAFKAPVGIDLAWHGGATGPSDPTAPSCKNTFSNLSVENAAIIGLDLDAAADCRVSGIDYRGFGTPIGVRMRLSGGSIYGDNWYLNDGRFVVSCQNAAFQNSTFLCGVEETSDALNHIHWDGCQFFAFQPNKFLPNGLSTSNGSTTVTANWPNHGLTTGNLVLVQSVDAPVGGIPAAELNGSHQITVTGANTLTFTSTTPASSTATGGGLAMRIIGRGPTFNSTGTSNATKGNSFSGCLFAGLVAGQYYFAGRWWSGATFDACRFESSLFFDPALFIPAGGAAQVPSFFFEQCSFGFTLPASIPNVVRVGFFGRQDSAGNISSSLILPGDLVTQNATFADGRVRIGGNYMFATAGNLAAWATSAPASDADGNILIQRQAGVASPVGSVTPAHVGAEFVDNANGRVYIAKGATNADWLEFARLSFGTVSPIGVRTPAQRGELFVDTVTSIIYQAVALTSADWVVVPRVAVAATSPVGVTAPLFTGQLWVNTAAGGTLFIGINPASTSGWLQVATGAGALGTMASQNANSVAITGGTITGITDLAIGDGGTGASTAGAARTNLGLGDMAVQTSSAVAITGGSVTGITDLAVADGGTGASTATAARTNLAAYGSAGGDLSGLVTQSAGNGVVVGGTALVAGVYAGAAITPTVQAQAAGATGLGAFRAGASASPPIFGLFKTRGASASAHTAVNTSDQLGAFSFGGSDGTAYRDGLRLIATVTGAPTATNVPTRFDALTGDGTSSFVGLGQDQSGNLQVNQQTVVTQARHIQLRSYTVAQALALPVTPAGQLIWVSDGTGNNRFATSNGTNWVWANTATTVS